MTQWTVKSRTRNRVLERYEPLQPFFLAALAQRLGCTTFIDIGANVGLYSIMFAGLESIGEVHAFEPAPNAFSHLSRNIELNRLGGRIAPHKVALSDKAGHVTFGIVDGLSGRNSITETSIHPASNFSSKVEVRTAPLDEILSCSDQRICVKLDVEGHEPEVIAGMAKLLTANSVLLQVEEWGDHRLEEILASHQMRRVCKIGHDWYFTNMECPPETIVEAFEQAGESLIASNLAGQEGAPIGAFLAPGLEVRLEGRLAALARRLKRMVESRQIFSRRPENG